MKDFTVEARPDIEFKINDDVFYAVGDTPGGVVLDLATMADQAEGKAKVASITVFLDSVLLPESAELFTSRLRDPANPITFTQIISVFEYLLEEYMGGEDAKRPTQGASSSSTGRRTTGRSSTGSARSRGSIQEEALSGAL